MVMYVWNAQQFNEIITVCHDKAPWLPRNQKQVLFNLRDPFNRVKFALKNEFVLSFCIEYYVGIIVTIISSR